MVHVTHALYLREREVQAGTTAQAIGAKAVITQRVGGR